MMFAIKAGVSDPGAEAFAFAAQKTMYGGKHIAEGDTIFVFASENEGGPGLIASGIVTSARAIAKKRGIARQTPHVSIAIRRTALARRPLGRSELKAFTDWNDGRPKTELNFKLYRQATNKIAESRMTQQLSSGDSSNAADSRIGLSVFSPPGRHPPCRQNGRRRESDRWRFPSLLPEPRVASMMELVPPIVA